MEHRLEVADTRPPDATDEPSFAAAVPRLSSAVPLQASAARVVDDADHGPSTTVDIRLSLRDRLLLNHYLHRARRRRGRGIHLPVPRLDADVPDGFEPPSSSSHRSGR